MATLPGQPVSLGVEAALDSAAAACAARGVQLTPLRRQVLRLAFEAGQPIGAYALLDRLRALRPGAAPPAVYRALDFLRDQGLVHRVERLNAFVACSVAAEGRDGPAHQFLICRRCGTTLELHDASVARALARATARVGFAAAHATVEVEGTCARCRTARPAEPASDDARSGASLPPDGRVSSEFM